MKSAFGVVVTAALALAACNKDPASQADRDHSGAPAKVAPYGTQASADQPDARKAPVPKADDGKPIWSANKQHTAQENAEYAFKRNGEVFEAKDLDDFVAKAHAFVNHPPKGVQKISRDNGDVELYDAKTNVFAVATKDGAPRTMFKPDNGAAYWDKELAKAADGGKSGSNGGERTTSHKRKSKNDDDS